MASGYIFIAILICLTIYVCGWELLVYEVGNTHREVYMLPGVYAGLTNQKVVFQAAVLYCLTKNLTLVLPKWSFDFNSYRNATIVPFDYLYSINDTKLIELADIKHLKYTTTLPENLLPSCMFQLQSLETFESQHTDALTLEQYAENYGVVCLNAKASFYGLGEILQQIYGYGYYLDFVSHSLVQSFRSVLVVSEVYQNIVSLILHRMRERFGHTTFVSVHARVEEDFKSYCKETIRKGLENHFSDTLRSCYESDESIYQLLKIVNVANNSLLLIMNFNRGDESFAELPQVCNSKCEEGHYDTCLVFHCIRKESLVSENELFELFPTLIKTTNSLAMIDSELAKYATLFVGNMYSTMSVDIWYERKLDQLPYWDSVFYNRLCSSYPAGYCP